MTGLDRHLIVRYLVGEASAEDERRLASWRNEDVENDREFNRIAGIWYATEQLRVASGNVPVRSASSIMDASESAARLPYVRSIETKTVGPRIIRKLASRRGLQVAASLLLGLGLGTALTFHLAANHGPFGPESLVTGVGEVTTVTLADQTVVRLAPESRIDFANGGSNRSVSLTGRAYFAVTPRSGEPFIVKLPTGVVRVTGTRFDVEGRDGGVRVAVVEGEVHLAVDGSELDVGASEVAQSRDGQELRSERVEDVYQVIDWLGGFLALESTPLTEVAQELERRFGIEVEISDPELGNRPVTGWFTDQSPEQMVMAICSVVEARCSTQNGVVRIEASLPLGGLSSVVQAPRRSDSRAGP